MYTTNAEDQAEAEKLKARLAAAKSAPSSSAKTFHRVPPATLADGRHKYVLIEAKEPDSDEPQYFVTSRKGAHYHRNAAEPLIHKLETSGYRDIEVKGGGRIMLSKENKEVSIFGFSYTFGQADHELSRKVVLSDDRYKDFDVTWSNDGY
jgi:phosphohistidine phosphatase